MCSDYASKNQLNLSFYQSNIEGELIEKIRIREIIIMV